ncbi:hypothetical protein ZIOFF_075010 [Zingiber officinale]|uniref:RRM domain-containing protein n=1 Tax=Zingiber officinale TaxID=94328 RepID=A0A8J5E8T5_ZINOF|nr:hypothetical protein ZIOFF_075010 [Zingiber officinale]
MAALDLQIASRTIIRWSIVSEKVALMQNKDVKMKDAIVDSAQKQTKKSEKKVPKTSTVQNPTSGSQTLYVGNLSYDVGPHDLSEFFKGVGEVVGARLATRGKGSSKGFGHVDFASEEDVKKALELNGQEFFGRPLKLEVARGRDSNTPQSGLGIPFKSILDHVETSLVYLYSRTMKVVPLKGQFFVSLLPFEISYQMFQMAFVDFKDQIAYKKAFELNVEEVVDEVGEATVVEDAAPVVGARVVVVDEVGEVIAVEDVALVVRAGVAVVQRGIPVMARHARIFWLKDPTVGLADNNYSCLLF